jgi:hypothetical protein
MIINKPQYNSTKLDGPAPSSPIVQMTVTSYKDLGLVPVDAKYPRKDGKTTVDTVEVIFTSPAGEQAKKDYQKSLNEKAKLFELVVAATGQIPGESFNMDDLLGKNVQVVGTLKTSAKGNKYYKVTSTVPGAPGQPVAKAPAPKPQGQVTAAPATVGW